MIDAGDTGKCFDNRLATRCVRRAPSSEAALCGDVLHAVAIKLSGSKGLVQKDSVVNFVLPDSSTRCLSSRETLSRHSARANAFSANVCCKEHTGLLLLAAPGNLPPYTGCFILTLASYAAKVMGLIVHFEIRHNKEAFLCIVS